MRLKFNPVKMPLIPGFNSMARPSNSFDSVTMTIAVTPQIKIYLEDLTADGMYGCSPSEAARLLLGQAIEQKIKEGVLTRRKFMVQNGEVKTTEPTALSS
ncbi:MAG: hypothetical protein LDL31_03700 [Prosthecobacter sp.]|nr:hypothetical protein [Prosthecobacter sp.]